jgi:putative transposase
LVYHVLNRANAGLNIFRSKVEYAAFVEALAEAHARVPVRLLGFCLMEDHWHLLVWPRKNGDLSEFMRWLTVTHTRRWHSHRHAAGTGHLYQGRYRSFPVEPGASLRTVLKYIESNARRQKLVRKAEDWPWSSLAVRAGKSVLDAEKLKLLDHLLDQGPTPLPPGWTATVNGVLEDDDLKALRNSVQRGTPFGTDGWRGKIVKKLNLEHTLRPRGRPRKNPLPDDAAEETTKKSKAAKPATTKTAGAKSVSSRTTTRKAASPLPRKAR